MTLRLRLPLFLIFVLAVATSFGQTPTPKPGDKPMAKPTPEAAATGQLAFPEIAEWTKDQITVYPMAGGGYSVNYNSPTSGRVTVYAYDSGHKTISNELKGLVADELENAKAGIQSAVDAGIYTNLKGGKSETITLGGSKGR